MTANRPIRWCGAVLAMLVGLTLLPAVPGHAQKAPAKPAKAPESSPPSAGPDQDQPLPGDWAPELLDGIISSPNDEAQSSLLRATFAAGPAVIPQLVTALKDDRTAEYAAQSLAYIGGEKALDILWKLLSDPRDLDLRRFTYGALAEYDSPQATDFLMNAIDKSDSEPDRTVTEAAVLALTMRTDSALLPRLATLEKKLLDVVIRDDVDNARTVIEERARYLASPEGQKAGGSIESAVRTYFIPALEPPTGLEAGSARPAPARGGKVSQAPAAKTPSLVSVNVRNVTFSPDKNRALARVVFEDPTAIAYYDFVLQKRTGNWTLASVWLGPEVEKVPAGSIDAGR